MPQAILEAIFVTHIKTPADTRPIVVLLEYHHLPNAVSHLIVTTSVAHQNLFLKLPITDSKQTNVYIKTSGFSSHEKHLWPVVKHELGRISVPNTPAGFFLQASIFIVYHQGF